MRVWSNNQVIFEYDYTKIDSITFALPGDPQNPENPNPDDPTKVDNGVYVVGAATPIASLDADNVEKALMAVGINEVNQERREGMFEKYIVLEAGKKFQIIEKVGTKLTKYGAELKEADIETDYDAISGYKGALAENVEMEVKKTALYHIIMDLNLDGRLKNVGGAQVIIVPVVWGVAGGMNGWGYTEGEATEITGGTEQITWTWEDQELGKKGIFKFKHSHAWKINMDDAENVKANANLGKDCWPAGADIEVNDAGKYKIELRYNLAGGDIQKSYSYEVTMTEKATIPETMYMIGNDFGNWDWGNPGVIELTPVHSHPGMFWCIRYLTTETQMKWCPVKAWKGDFSSLSTYEGFVKPDGNAQVEADGVYMIFIDYAGDKMSIYPAEVYGMGDCFGGWDMAKAENKFQIEEKKLVSPSFSASGNLRMYARIYADGVDWWQSEFNIFDGKIVYRGVEDDSWDDKNVAAQAGQRVVLDFNAGTGEIVNPGDATRQ